MAFNYGGFRVVDIINPNKHCTEIYFADDKNVELNRISLIIFEQQIKYIITEAYETHKKVKVYIINDEAPIVMDFQPDEYNLFESFFLSLYNKNI